MSTNSTKHPDASADLKAALATHFRRKAQSQASLTDQLLKLITLAHKEGLYDAADFVRNAMETRRPSGQPKDRT